MGQSSLGRPLGEPLNAELRAEKAQGCLKLCWDSPGDPVGFSKLTPLVLWERALGISVCLCCFNN